MENVVLIVHLLLAFALTATVLLQRSEGGGLGIGGGGGATAGRPAQTAVGKLTWILAAGFLCTSLTLYVLATSAGGGDSVTDNLPADGGEAEQSDPGGLSVDDEGLTPSLGGDASDPFLPNIGE